MGDIDNREAMCVCVGGQMVYGKCLGHPFNVVVNLENALKRKTFKKSYYIKNDMQ